MPQNNPKAIRNIGIYAHVDAGKTTITENFLYLSGAIRSLGSVDKGTAHTDYLEVERSRGISVRAASTTFLWKDTTINLIDTPGHMDFTAEVERSMRVLDGAILVVSAAEGVQAQTEMIWKALKSRNIPTLFFMNKIDRFGAEPQRVIHDIEQFLTPSILPIQYVRGLAEGNASISDAIQQVSGLAEGSACISDAIQQVSGLAESNACISDAIQCEIPYEDGLLERVCEGDDILLAQWLDGKSISPVVLQKSIQTQTKAGKLYPLLYGAALKSMGLKALLDAVVTYLPPPKINESDALAGIVFRIEQDKTMGKIAHVRLYGGALTNRDNVHNATQDIDEKITQIRKVSASKHEDIGYLAAGDIASVCGLSRARIGDILGSDSGVPVESHIAEPLLLVQVFPENDAAIPSLVAALQELSDEDPLLSLEWIKEERRLHIKIMGTIQLEILGSLLKTRFGLAATFGSPVVIYKETPSKAMTGYISYTMPKPCWAILEFYIKPLPRGSGVKTGGWVREEKLHSRYQRQVWQTLPSALRQGPLGWEVTDLEVTLLNGEHHIFHTHPLDFVTATPMGIMNGLLNTGTTLLEPMTACRISAPDTISSKILGDIVQMRGTFDPPVIVNGTFTVEARLPVATSMDYAVRLGAISGGRGLLSAHFDGYEPCPLELGTTTPYRGVNPADQAKYILYTRKALGDL